MVGAVWRWEDIVGSNWRRLGEVDHLGIAVILRRGEERGGEGRGGRGMEGRGGEEEREKGRSKVGKWMDWMAEGERGGEKGERYVAVGTSLITQSLSLSRPLHTYCTQLIVAV